MSDDAPPRLDVDPDAPPMAARALRAARADVPDAADLRRVEALLLARLAIATASGGSSGASGSGSPGASGAPPAPPAAPPVAGALGASGGSLGALAGGGIAFVALVCGGLYVSSLSSPASPPEAPAGEPQIVVTPPASFVPPPPEPTAAKVVSVDDLPKAPPVGPAPAATAASASAHAPTPPDPKEETRLVSDAQGTLRTNPSATLQACNDHAKKFPNGALAQERESLAIEALVALGRKPEARARLERFRAAYPASGHLRKLDALF